MWIWLHLLQFDVSNQTRNPKEDQYNKKDRPLPSGLISLRSAILLRWGLAPVCILSSLWYSHEAAVASAAVLALTILYNELGGSGYFVLKNMLNAAGFASFEWGALLVASKISQLRLWVSLYAANSTRS